MEYKGKDMFSTQGSKGFYGYVEVILTEWFLRTLFWDVATSLEYAAGSSLVRWDCPSHDCSDGRSPFSPTEQYYVDVNLFKYWKFKYWNLTDEFPTTEFGIQTGPDYVKNRMAIDIQYPALASHKESFFKSKIFFTRMYYFGCFHNFIRKHEEDQAVEVSTDDEEDIDTPTKGGKRRDVPTRPRNNKMIGVPVGVVDADPEPKRLVMGRFILKGGNLRIQYHAINYAVTGRYLEVGRKSAYQVRNSAMLEGIQFWREYDFNQTDSSRGMQLQCNERKKLARNLTSRGWRNGHLLGYESLITNDPLAWIGPPKSDFAVKYQQYTKSRNVDPDLLAAAVKKQPNKPQKSPNKPTKPKAEVRVENQGPISTRAQIRQKEKVLHEQILARDAAEESGNTNKFLKLKRSCEALRRALTELQSGFPEGTDIDEGPTLEDSNTEKFQENQEQDDYLGGLGSDIEQEEENSQGHGRQDNEGPNDENGKDMGVEAKTEKTSDSPNNSQIGAADRALKIVDNQLTKLQSQLTKQQSQLTKLHSQVNGTKRSIEDLEGVKESMPKKAKFELPALLVRAEDPFDASAFDGLDEIAARELYNWQGTQAPGFRERLSVKKIATLKKETQVRIEEHRKHEAELAKWVIKISEIVEIDFTLDGVPEPPNPNTGVQHPKPLKYDPREKLDRSKPYRSDNQIMVAIKHWHYGKQYPGDESTWSLIFEDQSARLIGVGEERGIRQQPSEEYWDTLDKVIRDWYREGNVTNVAMIVAKPFDDQFDVFPEDFPVPNPPKVGSFGVPPTVQSAAKDHTPKRPSPLGRRLIEGMKKSTPSKPTSSKPTSSKPTSSKPTSSKPTSSKPKSSQPAATKMSTKWVKPINTERVTSSDKEDKGPTGIEGAKGTGTNARLDYVDDGFLVEDDISADDDFLADLDDGPLIAAPTPRRMDSDDGNEDNVYGDCTPHKKGPRSTSTIEGERWVPQTPTGSHRKVAEGIVTEVREDADATIPGFDDELSSHGSDHN